MRVRYYLLLPLAAAVVAVLAGCMSVPEGDAGYAPPPYGQFQAYYEGDFCWIGDHYWPGVQPVFTDGLFLSPGFVAVVPFSFGWHSNYYGWRYRPSPYLNRPHYRFHHWYRVAPPFMPVQTPLRRWYTVPRPATGDRDHGFQHFAVRPAYGGHWILEGDARRK